MIDHISSFHKAFILHARPSSETSLLVDVLTEHFGKITLVARGVRQMQKSSRKGLLQPFIPLMMSWEGRGEYPFLKEIENFGQPIVLTHYALFSGFYLNELLVKLLPKHAPCELLFQLYEHTLNVMSQTTWLDPVLRFFEKQLLHELGHGFSCEHEIDSFKPIEPDSWYRWTSGGFKKLSSAIEPSKESNGFQGKNLLAIAKDDYTDLSVRRDAKRLMRQALDEQLRYQPLKSRELF